MLNDTPSLTSHSMMTHAPYFHRQVRQVRWHFSCLSRTRPCAVVVVEEPMMDSVALPETEDQPETEVCVGQNVCTPRTILEGLVAPRHFGKPSLAAPGEGVEIVVPDAEGLSSLQSPQREELKESDSTENDVGHVLQENRVLSEESEDPVPQAEDSFGPAMSSPLRHYIDGTVPDLLRSGSPLQRRVSSPVSNTVSRKESLQQHLTLRGER